MVSISSTEKNCILLFVKYPEKGRVKKRLTKELNAGFVSELYKKFVIDLVSKIEKLKVDFKICFYPTDSKKQFMKWLGEKQDYIPQKGDDLGDRMKYCFNTSFNEGFGNCILIGSDIPDLPMDFIKEAFKFLQKNDAVIGPASDGGYYLIGFKKNSFLPEIFKGITWGSESVYQNTMNIFKKTGIKVEVLQQWYDIDTLSDLKSLHQRNQNTEFRYSNTMSFLLKYKDIFK